LKRITPVAGYSTMMFRGRHVPDPVDLTPEEAVGFWSDVRVAAAAIGAVFQPCHLNDQLLGNAVPHVHVHILPRYLDDPSPKRPLGDSIWARGARVPPDALQAQVSDLRAAIAGHIGGRQQTLLLPARQLGCRSRVDDRSGSPPGAGPEGSAYAVSTTGT
jgi:diadenosine tetraphosphate (Ap4A) HIT family hydrolase